MPDPLVLTRFQRVLLGTDGTVTHILEAYTDEPIEVLKLRHDLDVPGPGDEALEAGPGTPVLRRHVVLRGRRSRQPLLYAEAVVVPGRLDPPVVDGLVGTDKPIGSLLAENRMETFREILAVDCEPAGACAGHLGVDPTADLIFRTYRIVFRGRPVMLITEKFPARSFRGLPG